MVTVPGFVPNQNFPQLCDKVTVGYDQKRGRFIKALENIPLGVVVCVEEGITVNVNPQVCYRCLKGIQNNGFAYCTDCEDFYEPDEIACGKYDNLGIFKLAAHLVFCYPFADMVALITQGEPEVATSAPTSLSTKDSASVFQLKPFPPIEEPFRLPQVQAAIAELVKSLESDVNWGRLDYNTRLLAFTKALRIMAERCAKNAHTVYTVEDLESKDRSLPLATGLFPIGAIFNHSCTPNVFGFFVRNTFIFVSRGVKAGEELTDTYGITYNQHTLAQRTEFLDNVSLFKCHCDACVQNKSLDRELERCFNDVDKCAQDASSLLDYRDFAEYMVPGSKEIENLIIAFSKRRDANVYDEYMFNLWKKFVENAKLRELDYDPYLVQPYVEMVILAWHEDVDCSDEEKASLLFTTHRLLTNFYVGFHPVSDLIKTLVDNAAKMTRNEIRNHVQRLRHRARMMWKREDYDDAP